jgi:hypothetical protein
MVGGSVGICTLSRDQKTGTPTMKLLTTNRQTVNATALARNCYVITIELFEYLVTIHRLLIKKK